jgi:Polyketide cyclase / dehydrase and lipid transport
MPRHQVSATGVVRAAPARVYAILADYRDGHPHVLPRPPFGDLIVEEGGVGAGTVIRFDMRVLGRTRRARGVVTEPEPGRVLAETYEDGTVTTFTVEPCDEGRHARVTIATDLQTRGWLLGMIERWLVTRLLRPVYVRELALLAAFAEKAEAARPEG